MDINVKQQADSFQQLAETTRSHERSHQQQVNMQCCIQMHGDERNGSINELAHYGMFRSPQDLAVFYCCSVSK